MEYKRATEGCECVGLPTFPVGNKKYWMNGYIYETDDNGVNKSVKECSCHKQWRMSTRCELFLKSHGLPDIAAIKSRKYKGTKSVKSFKQLVQLCLMSNAKLAKSIVYVNGPTMTQKTTSALDLILACFQKQKTVSYISMDELFALAQRSSSFDEDEDASAKLEDIFTNDIVIIDDAFQWDQIGGNFNKMKLTAPLVSKMIQSANGCIVFISQSPLDDIKKSTSNGASSLFSDSFYNYVWSTVSRCKSDLKFEDRVDIEGLREEISNGGLWD